LWEAKSTNNSDLNYIAYRKVNSVHRGPSVSRR